MGIMTIKEATYVSISDVMCFDVKDLFDGFCITDHTVVDSLDIISIANGVENRANVLIEDKHISELIKKSYESLTVGDVVRCFERTSILR